MITNKEELPDLETVVALSIKRLQEFNAMLLEQNPAQRDWLLNYTHEYLATILKQMFPYIDAEEIKTQAEKYNHAPLLTKK